ncbi:uncharacterized protein LOC143448586, partial [Clavelina lepadiformis]|uniref:uncharacterized protein LOC143448586 n=1 Tax=Clavelina lepadiformis TaxID=159417 RepID=UPI00404188A3
FANKSLNLIITSGSPSIQSHVCDQEAYSENSSIFARFEKIKEEFLLDDEQEGSVINVSEVLIGVIKLKESLFCKQHFFVGGTVLLLIESS